MNAVLTFLLILTFCGTAIVAPKEGPPAVVLCLPFALIAGCAIWRFERRNEFLLRLFAAGLCVRVVIATLINYFQGQTFFGGDADTYDLFGFALNQQWHGGGAIYQNLVTQFTGIGGSGWGMLYFVASIYEIVGRNPLAIQLVNTVIGAATPVIIFHIAQHIFDNTRVARVSAILVAFYPSIVLWSAQALKDGPIVFLLVLAMLATLKLGESFSVKFLVILIASALGLLTLRFYIFYMLIAAVTGAFAMGMRTFSAQSFVRQFGVIIIIGLSLTYMGITRYAGAQIENFGNLKTVQRSRGDASQSAQSGFAQDVDVSTTSGALAAIPIGLLYLLFAPFPWQLASLRQMITLPEMIVWWLSFPLLILGLWFTIRYRLRQISPILLFTTLLTLGYSVFQGNVGTAYRQRSQLLVFYFVFIAVGYILFKEKREDRKRQIEAQKEMLAAAQPARAYAPLKTPRDFGVKPAFRATTPAVTGDER
ncbi:MAG: glycosyltransferase family 39 protein [Pyrinomonadaceae bacterium]